MDRLVEWIEDAMEWLIEAWKKSHAICNVVLKKGDCKQCPLHWGLDDKDPCLGGLLDAIYEYMVEWQKQRDKEAEEEEDD